MSEKGEKFIKIPVTECDGFILNSILIEQIQHDLSPLKDLVKILVAEKYGVEAESCEEILHLLVEKLSKLEK